MLFACLLAVREGLEAALIVGIVLGTLRKLEYMRYARYVWLGAGAAALVSLAAGVTLTALGAEFEGYAEEVFEGVTMALAALILTWMIAWMMTRGRHLQAHLQGQVQQSLARTHQWGLFWLAGVAVVREGLELALFLAASAFASSALETVIGTFAGLAIAAALGWGISTATVRLDLRRFFQVTGVILVVVAAGLVAHSIHGFNEAGLVPAVVEHVWDINSVLSDTSTAGEFLKALVGYNAAPSLTEVVGYVVYIVLAGVVLCKSMWRAQSVRKVGRPWA